MSTAYLFWPLLSFFLFSRSSLAGRSHTASLPPSLTARIPTCAHACVRNFIAQEFGTASCRSRPDLACYCTSDNASGETLGEGALRCLATDCPDKRLEQELAAYEICEGIANAKPMTRQTIIATQTLYTYPSGCTTTSKRRRSSSSSCNPNAWTSITSSTTRRSPATPTITSTSARSPETHTVPSSSLSSMSSITSSSASATSSVGAAAPTVKPALTRPQIAGIAVGGVASIAFALGLLFFGRRLRRRRFNKRLSDSSFGNDRSIGSNPVSPRIFPTRNERPYLEELGLAVGSETRERLVVDENSPSGASYRTTSKLLPDKPSYSLYPSPLKIRHSTSPFSPVSDQLGGKAGIGQKGPMPLSRPSPRLCSSHDPGQFSTQRGVSTLHASASDPFLDDRCGSRALTSASPRRQPLQLETPSGHRPDTETINHGEWTQSLDDLRKPVAARSIRKRDFQNPACVSISPNEYTGRALFEESQQRPSHLRQEGKRANRIRPRRSMWIRDSSASDTNFEDTDEEEEIPPVPTSHPFMSPFQPYGGVAYSKIPGFAPPQPANQPPPPKVPSPRPARRNQPPPAPLMTPNQALRQKAGKKLPDLPDVGGTAAVGGHREPGPTIPRKGTKEMKDVQNTAKWKILVSTGLQGIENSPTLRPPGSGEGRPITPPKNAAARSPPTRSR